MNEKIFYRHKLFLRTSQSLSNDVLHGDVSLSFLFFFLISSLFLIIGDSVYFSSFFFYFMPLTTLSLLTLWQFTNVFLLRILSNNHFSAANKCNHSHETNSSRFIVVLRMFFTLNLRNQRYLLDIIFL